MKAQQKKINKALVMLFGVAAIAGASQASAQESTMKSMVVTATRTPIEEFEAPANISVITREKLEEKHYHDLGEAFKDVPGVILQNYGSTGANYSSNKLLINGTDKIVVLIDGVRANINGSFFNKFSASELVDLGRVERIEVLKGSASTLYGSDAQGGVINIITRRSAVGQLSTTVGYTGGSYALSQYNLRHSGSKDGFYWTLSGQKRASDDYKDGPGRTIPEDLHDTALGLKLGKKFDDGVSSIELDYSQYTSDYMRPKNYTAWTTPYYGKKNNSRIALAYVQKFSDQLTNQLSFSRNRNNLKDNYTNWSSRWFMDLETVGASDQLVYKGTDNVLTGGVDYYKDTMKSYHSGSDDYSNKKMFSTAYFIEDAWSFAPNWTLTPGVRLDDHSIYGKHTSPSLSLNYIAEKSTNYYVSYKEYFVAPIFPQLYGSYGNSNLKPEQGHAVEAGVKHQFNSTMNGMLNLYKRSSEDVIGCIGCTMVSVAGQYTNIGHEEARGASATLTKAFRKYYTATVGYTYAHINAQTGENTNRNGQIPRDAWNLGLGYAKERLSADLTVRGVEGRKFRASDTYQDKKTSYWIADIAANYEPYKGVKVFAKVNNLFDKYYTEQTYFADPAKWYPQPGRNFLAGLEYTF